MNTLIRRTPLADFGDMFDAMEKSFDAIWRNQNAASTGFVPLDIYEKEDAIYIRATVPGLMEEDLDLTLEKNVLTLKGELRNAWEGEGTKVYRRESPQGRFSRSVRLPEGVKTDETEAQFDRGILTIRVPKADPQKDQPLRIPIRQVIGNQSQTPALNQENESPEA